MKARPLAVIPKIAQRRLAAIRTASPTPVFALFRPRTTRLGERMSFRISAVASPSCKKRCCLRSRSFPSLQPVLESSLLPCTIPSSRFQPAEGVGRLNASPLLGGSQILVLKRRKPVASPTSTNVCVKIAIKTQSHATGKVVGAELFKEATGVASAARASSRANHMALFRAVNRGAYSAQGNARERDRSEDAGRRGGRHERSGERARRLGDQRPMQWAPGRCPLQGFRCRSRMEKTYWPPGGPPDFPGNGNTPRIIRVLQR